jgi:glycopeptide antibiotics resistance protein
VLIASAVAVPVLVAMVTLRARGFASVGPTRGDRHPWWVAATEVGAIAGTLPWLWMILTPLPQPGAVHPMPFQEVSGYFSVPPTEALVQVVGNLAVFAAAGALAPVRWRLGRGTGAVLAVVAGFAAAGSVLVETLQWALHLGRVTSVDDVLLNTAGAALAALVTRRWWRT